MLTVFFVVLLVFILLGVFKKDARSGTRPPRRDDPRSDYSSGFIDPLLPGQAMDGHSRHPLPPDDGCRNDSSDYGSSDYDTSDSSGSDFGSDCGGGGDSGGGDSGGGGGD
ncbi:hypothetical protein [Gorillibacterium sp. sgz500922]|uniref:hypothetical protein n=1 Tax=Gorillibacterium sp. sgz500922 TaxID=3446694 RepID=UPI003F681462